MGRESQICRVCTKRSKDFVDLEAIYGRKPSISYLEVYNICTQLNAAFDDELPKWLCLSCIKDLKSSFKFVEKARETDKRLRETIGRNRNTRSRRNEMPEEKTPLENAEPAFEEIKPEFINCTKDPLEDSDKEVNEKSEDEMDWVPDAVDDMQTDGFAEEKTATIDDDDDDDDKPLTQLIEKRKFAGKLTTGRSHEDNPDHDSSDIFNDLNLPANNDDSSENEGDLFEDKMMEVMPDPPSTQEAQIFPQGRYMCKMCKQTYFTADGLKAHMNVHLPKKKKVKRIRGPNKKNSKSKKKKKNAASDDEDEDDDEGSPDKDGEPKNCEETTETTQVQAKKNRKLKPPKPKKMFPCGVCGKHMISASKLRYHMVMHTGEKDFLCTMCPKAYSTIYALKHHMRTHTGERPYECKFCGDKFTRPTTLKSHMRRHTGERPYGCDICGKRFIQHSSMTTHMKLNHMAKTIGCPHCDKKYARQTDLNTHLLSHTGDKPFSCSLCPSRFIRQANLNKHMNQHHLAKNKSTKAQHSKKNLQLETDETASPEKEASAGLVPTSTTIQLMSSAPIPAESSPRMNNQFAVTQQKIVVATPQPPPTAVLNDTAMQQKINFAIATDQFNSVQAAPELPKMINVRSLARPMPKGTVTVAMRRVQDASTPPGSGSDESNASNRFLPNPPLLSPNAAPSQLRHTQMQQTAMLPPLTQQQQQRLPNNENSMPISMNIAGIPGGIPTHTMLAGTTGGITVHIGQHGQMGSVEHLKGIHPPVDNLTNLLGQVIDPERIGRSVEEVIPWSWSNNS